MAWTAPVLLPAVVPRPKAGGTAGGSGSSAMTWNPPAGSGPALNLPPHRLTRSRMPVIPWPVPVGEMLAAASPAGRPPSSVTRMTRSASV